MGCVHALERCSVSSRLGPIAGAVGNAALSPVDGGVSPTDTPKLQPSSVS